MRRGFTILELLIASLLLGILMSILTMVFSQSAIAWRTGMAAVADLDDVRKDISAVRHESDNAYLWGSDTHAILGLWDENGTLRSRAIDAVAGGNDSIKFLRGTLKREMKLGDITTVNVGSGNGSARFTSYTVNVKSAGPDRVFDTYDDIWSYPDDPSEW